ncbi:GNAT family N-acetyltransferase, partial [Nocardia wallacei]|uniref:GNAT family N-acetyltransferase n=1 Tax=Nocardia wallacei TaxID=480035 RepID=UPI002458BE31
GAVELLEGVRPSLRAAGSASVVLVSSNSTTTQPGWPVELAEACLAGARTVVHPLPFPDPPLSDGAVTPRPWRATDLPWRFESFSDPQCLRFSWPLTEPCTPEHVHRRFTDEEVARRAGTELALAVGSAADPEELLGSISLYDIERENARASIGYWLAARARGQGAATRAVRLLGRWAFAYLDLSRLELTCAPDNLPSQRVAERCGFLREGILRSHMAFQGGRRDTVVYGVVPGDLSASS